MNLNKLFILAGLVFALSACGGGGGSSGGGSGATAGSTTPVTTSPVDQTSGTPANSLTGVVFAAPSIGTSVTAYEVLANGSNGESLGTAGITPVDGTFTLTMNKAPTGFVRLVATGGTFASEADSTKQPITTLELVTPYVREDFKYFVVTPVTHIASKVFQLRAAAGDSHAAAYNAGMTRARGLAASNQFLTGETNAHVNILKTLPGSAADSRRSYLDLVVALEWFGVKYDLPSRTVFRIAAANAESNFSITGVDGSGAAINVGNWAGTTFNEAAPRTMAQLMTSAGAPGPELFLGTIDTVIMRDFYLVPACANVADRQALYDRYPSMLTFFGQPTTQFICDASTAGLAALRAKRATNIRATMQ
jgi:hypothetical protein